MEKGGFAPLQDLGSLTKLKKMFFVLSLDFWETTELSLQCVSLRSAPVCPDVEKINLNVTFRQNYCIT
jgi:hypothetical protein